MKIKEPKKYSERTLSALKRSVKHWEKNYQETDFDKIEIFSTHCPLCKLFLEKTYSCEGCPICDYIGKSDCVGSPWWKVYDMTCGNEESYTVLNPVSKKWIPTKKFKNAIKKEAAFLQKLYAKLMEQSLKTT